MKTTDHKGLSSYNWQKVAVRAMVLNQGNLLVSKIDSSDQVFEFDKGKWSLPGGILKHNDDLEAAVARGVLIHSGWQINSIRLYCINLYTDLENSEPSEIELIFIANAVNQTRNAEEMTDKLRWFPLTALPDRNEIISDHVDAIFSLAKMLHGGKTLNLDLLPPVFTKTKIRKGLPLLLPTI
jgi:8-oxo-dGTP diphosphatase